MLTLKRAQDIARGYMAPRSHQINYFAQHGTLLHTFNESTLTPTEDTAKQELLDAIEQEWIELRKERSLLMGKLRDESTTMPQADITAASSRIMENRQQAFELSDLVGFLYLYFSD